MWLFPHRLAVAIVAVAVLATVGVFAFARPAYRAPNHGGETIVFKEAVPPSHGWRWDDPTPGFHLGEDGDKWNLYGLAPRDIPVGAGVLAAGRFSVHSRPAVIYAKDGCIGIRPSLGTSRVLCPPKSPVVLVADAVKPFGTKLYPLDITGVARSDVTRVTVHLRAMTFVDDRSGTPVVRHEPPETVYSAKQPFWWGSFILSRSQPVPWDATVKVYGRRGLIVAQRIRFTHPGEAVYCPSATSVSCR